jgi:hypothetical protein
MLLALLNKSKSKGNSGFDVDGLTNSKNKSDSVFDIDVLTNSKSECDELINKLFNFLNELTYKSDLTDRTINLSNELLGTLKIMENCISCEKDNIKEYYFDVFHKFINELELEKEQEQKKKKIINEELNEILIN